MALKFALDLPEDFDETRDLTLVQTAKLYLSLSSSLPNGKGGRGEEEGEKDIKITIRQLIEGEEYKDEDSFSRSNQDRASSDLNSKTIIIESATFKVSEILGEERKEGASRSGPRGTIQSEEEEEEEEEEKGEASELEFDISHTVQVWLREPEENLGLVIECEGCYEAQLELKQNPTLRVDLERRRRSKNSFLHPLSLAGRQKRSYFRSSIKAKRRNRVDCKPDAVFHKKGRKNKKQRCCREKMTINFAELPGFENILQPTTFDAYFCQGRCPSRFNPANGHALLQSLMHVASKHLPKEERVPQPCCAPSKMLPLPILHYTGKLEVSHWKNVIVGECKCT